MAWDNTLTKLASGELITKAWGDAIVDNIDYLANRPYAFLEQAGSSQTANSTTFVAISSFAPVITPQRDSDVFVIAHVRLSSGTAGDIARVRITANGAEVTTTQNTMLVASQSQDVFVFGKFTATANTSYTLGLAFNRQSGSGTITNSNTLNANRLFALEIN